MAHIEPTDLVRLALGNETSSSDADVLRHIAVCDHCRDELSRMTRVVVAARAVQASDLPAPPPEHVWQRITQELSPTAEPAPPPTVPRTLRGRPAGAHRTPRSAAPGTPASRLVLGGLLAGAAAAVWWARRAR
ncbi:hypothetical protein [Streptomyces sp. NPDC054887]